MLSNIVDVGNAKNRTTLHQVVAAQEEVKKNNGKS